MKLTANQAKLLAAIKAGVRVSFHPYMGRFNPKEHYYAPGIGSCTATARALLRRKLVERTEQERHSRAHILALTEAGREWMPKMERQ